MSAPRSVGSGSDEPTRSGAGEPADSSISSISSISASPEEAADALALVQLSGVIRDTFARVADRHDLTPVQGRMLCVLAERPHGMAELARLFGVGKANLTGLVDRAAQRGLVERALVPGDRRAVRVVLTDDGRRAALAFHRDVTGELTGLLAPLTPEARAGLRETAAVVARSAGAGAAGAPPPGC
ncbi:MarR family winged helix-turn-helix transcriptional regulator [Streptomyces hainanensis]|nr:MarR family transcriptional regulator [Streptomyces hainanensis]